MTSVIYSFANRVNGKIYVGQATDKDKRFKEHTKCLNGFYHCNLYLQRSWIKYGPEAFEFKVLEECSIESLNEREQYWIDTLDCVQPKGYNIAPVAGSMLNYKHTVEARANMSKAHIGKRPTKETKLKMSISKIGNTINVGRSQKLQIESMRLATKGKPKSAEHKAKIAAGNSGKLVSEETRKKMSIAAKRRYARVD